MSKSTPILAMVAAFAAASAQAATDPDDMARRSERRAMVQQQLRAVQVELYCDHQDNAMHLLRDARRQLMAQRLPVSAPELRQLEKVSWLVRHGDTVEAIATIDAARGDLACAQAHGPSIRFPISQPSTGRAAPRPATADLLRSQFEPGRLS